MTNDKVSKLALSLAAMIVEWVDGGIKMGTNWRDMSGVIEKRIRRFAIPETDAAWAEVNALRWQLHDIGENGAFRLSDAERDILAERKRQQTAEGFSVERDDAYKTDELPRAAACYLMSALHYQTFFQKIPGVWPFAYSWFKPRSRRRDLVRAAALIVAEIERIDRSDERVRVAKKRVTQ